MATHIVTVVGVITMPIMIYIAPQQGNGVLSDPDSSTWTPTTGPFRSILNDLIDLPSGDRFDEIDHPARRVSICTVIASTATHDAIVADGRATAALPIRATDGAHLRQILDAPFSSYPVGWRNAARAFLESHGVDTDWITGTDTMRDVLRFIVKLFSVVQIADGRGESNVKEFIKENLDTPVGNIPAAKRDAISTWLTNHGIDVSWVTGSTTVREVVRILPENLGKLYGRNVAIRFSGEGL